MAQWRPTEKELKSVEYLASLGHTELQLATALGISESTLQMTFKKCVALSQAVSRGRAKAHQEMGKRAWEMALSDPGMMKFWLSCKMGWTKAAQKVELTGANGGPIETSQETEEEKKLRVDAAIARIKQSLSK